VNPLAAPIEDDCIAFHIDPSLRKDPEDLPGGIAGLGRKAGSAAPLGKMRYETDFNHRI
jgi:hypothetical protein